MTHCFQTEVRPAIDFDLGVERLSLSSPGVMLLLYLVNGHRRMRCAGKVALSAFQLSRAKKILQQGK
jgi:hypothetical protein